MPTSGGEAHSHRRPPGVARARAISLVAVGALAGGVAIASTITPWSHQVSQPRPGSGPGGASRAPDTGPAVLPAPPAAGAEQPVEPAAAPTLAPTVSTGLPDLPPPLTRGPAPAVWRADGPGAFLRTPWNTVGAVPPRVTSEEVSFQLVGRGQRSELEPAVPAVHEGDQHDLTCSVRLDGEFAAGSGTRQVIARWENDSPGQAPLELRVTDGQLVLHGGEGHPSGPRSFTRVLGRAPVGEWTQLRVLVRFSADPDKAAVSVWRDGRLLVDDDHPRGGTLYPGQQSYLKVGLHRDRTVAAASAVRFRGWHIDHGRADADPAARRSSGPATGDRASAGSDRSSPRVTERSAAVGSDPVVGGRTIRHDTSSRHGSDREGSGEGSTSGRSSTASVEPDHRTSRSGTSHRQESDDDSTSGHRDEPGRLRAHDDASPRGTSGDGGSHRDSSRHRASTDTDTGGGDDSNHRSGDDSDHRSGDG